jgi:hypothetical protein
LKQVSKLINGVECIKDFVLASKNADIVSIEVLLDNNGVFEIEDLNKKIVVANKQDFLNWYESKLLETKIEKVEFDQCIGCSFGNHVVIFNKGTFPRRPQEFTGSTKAGIMFTISEGMISKTQLCINFLKTENRTVFQCVGDEVAKNIKAGYSDAEAVAMYDANPNSEFSYITKKVNEEFNNGFF